jgi:hypothetical protein
MQVAFNLLRRRVTHSTEMFSLTMRLHTLQSPAVGGRCSSCQAKIVFCACGANPPAIGPKPGPNSSTLRAQSVSRSAQPRPLASAPPLPPPTAPRNAAAQPRPVASAPPLPPPTAPRNAATFTLQLREDDDSDDEGPYMCEDCGDDYDTKEEMRACCGTGAAPVEPPPPPRPATRTAPSEPPPPPPVSDAEPNPLVSPSVPPRQPPPPPPPSETDTPLSMPPQGLPPSATREGDGPAVPPRPAFTKPTPAPANESESEEAPFMCHCGCLLWPLLRFFRDIS